ncbi:MAG: efflux RND transporter periplasmic adaptor subunit [Candidatus Aminicenantes bacterium]|nr:efflux RND transporter periplasmic adaptor subunit [Candidatus Aminicenantes bacterium]
MKKKILLIAIGAVIVIGAVLGLTVFRNGRNGAVKYRTEAIARGDVEAIVLTTGTLNPIEIVDVGSQVSGKVEKLGADYNSQVTRGQIVAELDQEPLRMRVEQNEANYQSSVASLDRSKVTLETSEKNYERAKALFEKDLLSLEEMEGTEAAYLGAKADLVSAQARLAQSKSTLDLSKIDLSYAVIRSPVDGMVITRKVNIGQTVQASFQAPVLFQVATDLTKMKVECSVDEADIGKVKEGQKVRFTVEAFPDENFTGVVQQVRFSPETVQNVVTYTTIVNVENPQRKLRPGMTATVSIIVGEAKGVLRVPNAALRYNPNLPQGEMEKIMKEVAEQMMAQRQQAGQTGEGRGPSAGPEQAATGQPQATVSQSPAQGGGGQAQGQGQRPAAFLGQGGQGSSQRRQPTRVWVQDAAGKLRIIFLRTGVTDNTYSEIVRSELKEGDQVIIGDSTSTSTTSQTERRGGPPGGMMFIRR